MSMFYCANIRKPSSRAISPVPPGSNWLKLKEYTVLDIGGSKLPERLISELETKLLWKQGEFQKDRLLPASVLHNDVGLKMWEQMNRQPSYYQTNDEIVLLEHDSQGIVKYFQKECCLIDLGAGYVVGRITWHPLQILLHGS
jgi:Histidine-specific methyltransferase, SAM-dependent